MTQDQAAQDRTAQERFVVEHRESESRFVLLDRGEHPGAEGTAAKEIGEESYAVTGFGEKPHRILYHTFVDPSYSGQGLASVLVREAVDRSIADGFDIVPVCPYVVKWVAKHDDEYAGNIVKPTSKHLAAIEG
ncbi:GNAT family N-acetyltransferase [Leucobacter sp. gxy201]|uniref:GNAT family N-acetyltransferase n=1 Tax=Leucobacter sp. gxy201 TaxID=2957200 RepID=UPI003DA0D2F5